MKLASKISITQSVGILIFAIVIIICANFIWLRSYMVLEQQVANERGQRLQTVIEQDFSYIQKKALDYAKWDELYSYLAGNNPKYPSEYLTVNSVDLADVDAIAMYYPTGQLVAIGAGSDYESSKAELQEAFSQLLLSGLMAMKPDKQSCVSLLGTSWIVSISPITMNTDSSAKPDGWLVMANALDEQFVVKNKDLAKVNASVDVVELSKLSSSVQAQIVDDKSFVQYIGDTSDDLNGYVIIRSVNASPLVLRLVQPKVYGAVTNTLKFIAALLVAAAVFVFVIYKLMNKTVFSRLKQLDRFIASLINSRMIDKRLVIEGDDELATTAKLLNRLLDRLEKIYGDNKQLLADIRRELGERKKTQMELEVAWRAAKQADATKHAFVSNMNHELRTPINAVTGLGSILLGTNLDKDQAELVKEMVSAAKALTMIIEDLLDLAEPKYQMELRARSFAPDEALAAVIVLLMSKALGKGLRLDREIASNVPKKLVGDDVRWRQIVLNLLSNAIKYTDSGGIAVTLTTEHYEGGCLLKLTVVDSGLGMEESQMKKVFEPFYQVDDSLTREYGGLGLGLALVKKSVELMDGTINCHSRLAEGTTFTVVVPMKLDEIGEDE